MAKKSQAEQLLGATNPTHLKQIAIGSFLAFFVFAGSFITGDAFFSVFTGNNSILATTISAEPTSGSCGPGCGYGTSYKGSNNGGYPGMTTIGSDGRMLGDTDKNGSLSSTEINSWNATHNPDGSAKVGTGTQQKTPAGGGGGGTSPTQSAPQKSSMYGNDAGCLSATGCDGAGGF